jgi:plasmid replication initiation protein
MSKRQVVKQNYKLVNARYKLNTSEIKIIMNAISEIDADDGGFQTRKISVQELTRELCVEVKYSRLKTFCEDLFKKPIFIPKDNGGFLVASWFSSLEYKAGEGVIEYEISPKLAPYLLELKERFVKYNLRYILPLQSSYSIRIYQLLKEYEKLSRRTFTIEELRELLSVPKSYLYADFKRKILQPAERELIENCDIFFEFEEIKKGRRVNELLFRIKPNKSKHDAGASLFELEPSKFAKYKHRKLKTKDGAKEINFIEDLGDTLKVYFTDAAHALIPDEEMLKKALLA